MNNNTIVLVSDYNGDNFILKQVPYSHVKNGEDYLYENLLCKRCYGKDDEVIVNIDDDDIETIEKIL